ncbi:MAG TPA: methylenetetrahydrofolate reductase [Pseudolabrys sp.]|jgi:methylenetetrahydrofolate reductase (NADPH)
MLAEAAPARDPAAFARSFSLEATRPNAAEIEALAGLLPAGTLVYLPAVPTVATRELVAAAAALRKAGLEPVAHIAARRLSNAEQLNDLLAGLRSEADMRRLLVIGGDVDKSGPFAEALAVIQKGRLREAGIEEIGVAGYPEGHSRIAPERLEAALDQKIAAARAAGLRVHIISQFSFAPEAVVGWLRRLRQCGIAVPVKVGMAGPANVTALLRYAKRCGVNASLRGLMSGAAAGLIGRAGPEPMIDALAAAGGIGEASPHYFSFGGVLQTARYACDAAAGRLPADRAMAQPNNA